MRAHGRARVDPRYPQAFGWCDRCQFQFNLVDLHWQYQWAGVQLQNKRILVCPRCMDIPQEQLRVITLPPDPVPVQNPRPPRAAGDGFGPQPDGTTPNPDPNNPFLPPAVPIPTPPGPPTPTVESFALREDGGFALREDDGDELREIPP